VGGGIYRVAFLSYGARVSLFQSPPNFKSVPQFLERKRGESKGKYPIQVVTTRVEPDKSHEIYIAFD
jgi:hypothetical protein